MPVSRPTPPPSLAHEATVRTLAIADGLFPDSLRPETPAVVRIAIGLLARCVTTGHACLHLAGLDRNTDLLAAVRTLFEHTVTFAWLVGSNEAEHRMLLWQRFCDEQALRLDDENVRLGAEQRISAATRAEIADATRALANARMPGLADRAAQADREWSERLGLDGEHRDAWSLRRTYTSVFRVGSAVAHPTLAGLTFVTDRRPDRVIIGVEPATGSDDALAAVPALLGAALAVSAHALGRPNLEQVTAIADWLSSQRTSSADQAS